MVYLQYHIYDRALVPIYLYSIAKLPAGLNAVIEASKVAVTPCCCMGGVNWG